MIEFDESMFMNTFFERTSTLEVLLSFVDLIGRDCYDNLLYDGPEWYNIKGLVRPDEKENPTPCP